MDGRIGLISGAVFAGVLAAGAMAAGPAGVNLNPIDGVTSTASSLGIGSEEDSKPQDAYVVDTFSTILDDGQAAYRSDTYVYSDDCDGDDEYDEHDDECDDDHDDDKHDTHDDDDDDGHDSKSSSKTVLQNPITSTGSELNLKPDSSSGSKSKESSEKSEKKSKDDSKKKEHD